jgi:hypothetical protein
MKRYCYCYKYKTPNKFLSKTAMFSSEVTHLTLSRIQTLGVGGIYLRL